MVAVPLAAEAEAHARRVGELLAHHLHVRQLAVHQEWCAESCTQWRWAQCIKCTRMSRPRALRSLWRRTEELLWYEEQTDEDESDARETERDEHQENQHKAGLVQRVKNPRKRESPQESLKKKLN